MTCNLEQQIISTYYKDYKFFFSKPNVQGIGFGYKYVKGICTCEPCIHVFVNKKVAENCVPNNGIIPSLYKGIKTDVIETGTFSANDCSCNVSNSNRPLAPVYIDRIRPIQPGYCVSPATPSPTATFGYIATDNEQISRTYCLLSTARSFAPNGLAEEAGTQIVQPARIFGGRSPGDVVANVIRFVPIKSSSSIPNSLDDYNTVDCAIASYVSVGEVELINPIIPKIGIVRGIVSPQLVKPIQWTGCIAGNQRGVILSIKAIVKVRYDAFKDAYFKDIAISGGTRSYNGDFGALVCDINKNAMGLLFANNIEGTNIYNLICTMDNIQSKLDITLLTFRI